MSRPVSFYVLLGILAGVLFLSYRVLANFFVPLFLAVVLAVMFRPWHRWILERCRGRTHLAALLSTVAVVLSVLIPLGGVLSLAAREGLAIVATVDVRTVRARLDKLRTRLHLEIPHGEAVQNLEAALLRLLSAVRSPTPRAEQEAAFTAVAEQWRTLHDALNESERSPFTALADSLTSLRREDLGTAEFHAAVEQALLALRHGEELLLGDMPGAYLKKLANPSAEQLRALRDRGLAIAKSGLAEATAGTAAGLGQLFLAGTIMLVALFFFFADGPSLVDGVTRLTPLDERYQRELIGEFDKLSRAVVLATLLSAVVQGLLAGIGYWLTGVGSLFLLTLVTAVFALVPLFGAWMVWMPAALWLYFVEDRATAAIFLAVYGAVVVSLADNVVKLFVLHGQSNLHPLLALLSVIGGVQALGPIGILVGPMIVAFLQTLLDIFRRELGTLETAPRPAETSASAKPNKRRR